MYVRSVIAALWVTLLLLTPGCQQSRPKHEDAGSSLPPMASDTVLRIHWIGKRQLAVEGGAYYFNRIWNLPASQQLEARAFDELAIAPWRLLKEESAVAGAPAHAMRPLFDNLAYEESYLELRSKNNGSFELALAIQLRDQAAGGWQTNLAIVVQSLTGFSPSKGRADKPGWTVVHPQAPARFEFARAGGWTVFGIATAQNQLMDQLIDRVTSHSDPFGTQGTNLWLSVDVDLNWLAKAVGTTTNRPGRLPFVSAAVAGDGGHVLTDGILKFPQPLEEPLPQWNIPTGLIQGRLTGFLAMRSIHPLLSSLPWPNGLPLHETPDQAYFWSQAGNPFQVYAAVPMADARAQMDALSEQLLGKANPWLRLHGPRVNGQDCPLFEPFLDGNGVHWGDMAGVKPFIKSVTTDSAGFLFAGLFPPTTAAAPSSIQSQLVQELLNRTNLVYLGWEDTPARLNQWLPVLQTTRALTHLAPLPKQGLSLEWLAAMQSRVDETKTAVTQTAPNILKIHRQSTLGFNATELHLIADWLASPKFPRGLYSLLGQRPQQPAE